MSSNTPRIGLYMPADDGSEPINVATDLNDNLEKIDSTVGFVPSTQATPPVAPFDGLTTYETDTGRAKFRRGGVWNYLLSAGSSFLGNVLIDTAYRIAIGTTVPTAILDLVVPNITSAPILKAKQDSESFPRVQLDHNSLSFGPGNINADTKIYRQSANTLSISGSVTMENSLTVAGNVFVPNLNISGDLNVDGNVTGDLFVSGSFGGNGIDVPRTIRKITDTNRTATNTSTADPELQFTVEANTIYAVEAMIFYISDAAADFKSSWIGPGTTNGLRAVIGQALSAANRDDATIRIGAYGMTGDLTFAGTTSNFNAVWERIHLTSDTAGTVSFRWAQVTSNPALTAVKAGSYIIVKKVA